MTSTFHSVLPQPEAEELTAVTEVQHTAHAALKDLVSSHELRVVYQPIVQMADGALFGYEALLRCGDPRYPTPLELLRCATEGRRTGALGRAVRQLAVPRAPDVALFVNVHPEEFSESWLTRGDDPLFDHGHEVYVEITEAAPLRHFDRSHPFFQLIRERDNMHLVVDDLGAGFSNLRRIADLEPEMVKVDRNLVRGLGSNQRQRRLLRAVVRLCEDLGAQVVAEGIETVDEFLAARDAGAHYAQGYLLARPAYPGPAVFWTPDTDQSRKRS